ncbi:MAG: hypothetical protein K2J92_00425 [Muribaculaceae bacterium]|nr:hypothetical protein [Muribaculaceae bacterium]
MKTTKLMCAFAAAAMLTAATSCDKNDPESSYTVSYSIYNLYTPLSGDQAAHVSTAAYQLRYDFINSTVEIGASDLIWNNSTYSFSTDAVRFTNGYYDDGGEVIEFKNAKASVSGMTVDMSGMLTNRKYYTTQSVPGITGGVLQYTQVPVIAFSYNIGDLYSVRTFNPEAYMGGTTLTTYEMNGETKHYTNDKMLYRTIIDIQKMTADMVIYNARFAEEQPVELLAIAVKDLKVEWTPNGYRMTGSDIIPEYLEANELQPLPRYIFNNISLVTTGDRMTDFTLDYEVAGQYKGNFTGSVILPTADTNK